MDQEQFTRAVNETRWHLGQVWKKYRSRPLVPERNAERPWYAAHLAWMLNEMERFYAEGKIEKANRWLGFVQGALVCKHDVPLEYMKRANMPPGADYDPGRV